MSGSYFTSTELSDWSAGAVCGDWSSVFGHEHGKKHNWSLLNVTGVYWLWGWLMILKLCMNAVSQRYCGVLLYLLCVRQRLERRLISADTSDCPLSRIPRCLHLSGCRNHTVSSDWPAEHQSHPKAVWSRETWLWKPRWEPQGEQHRPNLI